jgi:hypothetical protein
VTDVDVTDNAPTTGMLPEATAALPTVIPPATVLDEATVKSRLNSVNPFEYVCQEETGYTKVSSEAKGTHEAHDIL